MSTSPTRVGSLLSGIGRVTKSVLAGAVGGSIILFGNIYTDPAQNTAPSQCYGSGCYATYQESILTVSGSKLIASIPVSPRFLSGAVIQRSTVECGAVTIASSGAVVIQTAPSKLSISNGTQLRTNVRIGAGSVTTMSTGALIQTKVPSGQYVNFITTGSGGSPTNADCKFRLWTHEKYGK